MSKSIPIYRNHDGNYQADPCLPLVEAVSKRQVRLEALVRGHYPGRRLPKETLLGIKTVGYWDAAEDQDWGLPWHRNEGVELTFLESGSLDFAVEDREYVLRPDALTLTRPWQRHRVGAPAIRASRLCWLIVDVGVRRPNQAWKWPDWLMLSKPDLNELTNVLRHNERPVWRASSDIRRCFREISQAVESDSKGSSVSRLTVRLNELFLMLVDLFRSENVRLDQSLSSSRRTVELFLADLRAHPEHAEPGWSVETMAAGCGLGSTQFIYYVKLLTNMTPVHFVNLCRLELAARLLREQPSVPVLEIALSAGFSSSQYFATVFQRRFGCSPRDYRAAAIAV